MFNNCFIVYAYSHFFQYSFLLALLSPSTDGKITTLDKKQFEERIKKPRDNLELLTILDDLSVKDGKEIEVAIRMRDCGRECTFALTHIYWA